MIQEVFRVSKEVAPRSKYHVLAHLMEEAGELATEVSISEGGSYKVPGKDGIVGEAVDVMLCALDMIYVVNSETDPEDVERQILEVIKNKLDKWKKNSQPA